jgi:hypothetical protein
MLTILPLLIDDSRLPLEARRALKLARTSPDAAVALGLKRSAARSLMRSFDLSWDEVAELVELPPHEIPANRAA